MTIAAFSSIALSLIGIYLYLSPGLPSIETLKDTRLQTPLRVYSSDNKLIGEFGEKRRMPIKFSDIPHSYIDALLSAEDDQFFTHKGVSIKALLRASSQLAMSGDIHSGGSTITMQVARNFFLSNKQTFKRKFNEILLALRIERELSKEEILELYVNVIFLGNRAYGIQAAAQVYFGKSLNELSLAELATLAGIPKAPSTINPIANPNRARERRDWILGRMHELGKIDAQTMELAQREAVKAEFHGANIEVDAP
ncbi:MAG TPA: transglycosylase domain-containing protein, partial [Cellvibrionaceae bacterium]|nr:transglycosylase domain-containing protein [Cellvibrionaceae bacterium]